MPRLFVDISAHGFGHLAQTAPVLNALTQSFPLALTVRCALPPDIVRSRILGRFDLITRQSDIGFVMKDAISIDAQKTADAYRALHADWERHLAEEAAFLSSIRPDLVLTNVAYLPLAGARQAGIPGVSMSSLNWLDLFTHFFGHESWSETIIQHQSAAYNGAKAFLLLTPGMPTAIQRMIKTSVVATPGKDRRVQLREKLRCADGDKIVLAAFGGIDKRLPLDRWPRVSGRRWLVPEKWKIRRPDTMSIESLDWPFPDLLRGVDAVLTKPGYGTFTEAACNGTPILFIRRDRWPEQTPLIDWLKINARCLEILPDTLENGQLNEALDTLLSQPPKPLPRPDGIVEIKSILARFLKLPAETTPGA